MYDIEEEIRNYTEKDYKNGNERTREKIAGLDKQGEYLKLTIYDSSELVREQVAKNGLGLDILVGDPCISVRQAVLRKAIEQHQKGNEQAKLKYIDRLLKDDSAAVRHILATNPYYCDELTTDSDYAVRRAVAESSYNMDLVATLKKDKDEEVRLSAEDRLLDLKYVNFIMAEGNPQQVLQLNGVTYEIYDKLTDKQLEELVEASYTIEEKRYKVTLDGNTMKIK